MARNSVLFDVREFIRHPHAWPGGYPKILIMDDGECLCAACARAEYRLISDSTRHARRDGWEAAAIDINWESQLWCAHCSAELESAYGSDDE